MDIASKEQWYWLSNGMSAGTRGSLLTDAARRALWVGAVCVALLLLWVVA